MARPPKRKMKDTPFRCENGHDFTAKMEWLGHDAGEEAGSQVIKWVPGKAVNIACPECGSTRIELVE
jgi:hypothetical protein